MHLFFDDSRNIYLAGLNLSTVLSKFVYLQDMRSNCNLKDIIEALTMAQKYLQFKLENAVVDFG